MRVRSVHIAHARCSAFVWRVGAFDFMRHCADWALYDIKYRESYSKRAILTSLAVFCCQASVPLRRVELEKRTERESEGMGFEETIHLWTTVNEFISLKDVNSLNASRSAKPNMKDKM